jgi:hypothetical protein
MRLSYIPLPACEGLHLAVLHRFSSVSGGFDNWAGEF